MSKKQAFTLLEVLLAAVIFVIAVAGMFATLNAVRQPVLEKERALTAAVLGRKQLEALRHEVSADNINSTIDGYFYQGALSLGSHNSLPATKVDGVSYTINYTVSCVTASAGSPDRCAPDSAVMVNEIISFPDA